MTEKDQSGLVAAPTVASARPTAAAAALESDWTLNIYVRYRTLFGGSSMCDSSTGSLEEALIQLQYALGDYYSRGKRATEFSPLDASLCVLREACVAAQISLFGAGSGPKDYPDKSEKSIF